MWNPLVGFFFKWSDKDVAIFLIFLGLLFIMWFFAGIWMVGLAGIGILIFGLFLLIKPLKT